MTSSLTPMTLTSIENRSSSVICPSTAHARASADKPADAASSPFPGHRLLLPTETSKPPETDVPPCQFNPPKPRASARRAGIARGTGVRGDPGTPAGTPGGSGGPDGCPVGRARSVPGMRPRLARQARSSRAYPAPRCWHARTGQCHPWPVRPVLSSGNSPRSTDIPRVPSGHVLPVAHPGPR
jgi:hypothetical protein